MVVTEASWIVIGGADRGGILVREGRDTASPQASERLSTGALVRQLELDGERLRYKRLTGAGPAEGWVSIRVPGKDLVVPAAGVCEVVGGGERGGIVVRTGCDLSSPLVPERLSTGSLIRQLQLEGERLHYELLSGMGPAVGWVSTRLTDGRDLVRSALAVLPADVVAGSPPGTQPKAGRRLRVLALHGRMSNPSIMKLQIAPLRVELGKDAEWLYLEAPLLWEAVDGMPADLFRPGDPPMEPSEFELRVAKGQPFRRWFIIDPATDEDPEVQKYRFGNQAVEHLRSYLASEGPIDVILSFSQASNVVSMLVHTLQREGLTPTWRLSVFFCGGRPRDPAYIAEEPSAQPTVRVWGGLHDPFFPGGEPSLQPLYTNVLELEHGDGHGFPSTQPRAGEVYAHVAREIRSRCQGC